MAHISKDPRVIFFNSGTAHDNVVTASREDAEALIEEYKPNVRYGITGHGDRWDFSII